MLLHNQLMVCTTFTAPPATFLPCRCSRVSLAGLPLPCIQCR